MAYHPPRMDDVSKEDFELYNQVMEGCYRYHDLMLNALLQYAGKDTLVMIISDHGYSSGNNRLDKKNAEMMPEACHRHYGVACVNGPGIKKGEKLYGAYLLDIVPNILACLDLPVGDDMDGRVWSEIFTQRYQRKNNLSWELVPGEDGMHSNDMEQTPSEAAEAMQHLVDLGYIDPPDENIQKTIQATLRDQNCNLARSYMDAGKFNEAMSILEDLLEQNPKISFYISLAIACSIHLEDLEKSKKFIAKLSNELQEKPYVMALKAVIHKKEGDKDAALKYLEEVLKENPKSAQIYNLIGETFSELELWNKAESAYRKALEVDPDNAVTHDRIAKVSICNKKYAQAIEHALESVGLIHYSPSAHFHLGVALAESNYLRESISAFETCLSIAKNKTQIYSWLMKLYKKVGRADKVKEYGQMNLELKNKPSFFFAE